MLNAWTMWWNADRLAHGWHRYWDAPIFHPERGSFAFSDPQPASWLVAPIVWWTGSPIPAYHAYLVLSLVLNGVFAVRLLRFLRMNWLVSASGGLAVLFHPLVHQHGEAIQLMPLWGVLWTFEMLLRLHRRPTRRRGAALGMAFSTVFLTSVHHGLFLTLLLGLSGWVLIPRGRWRRWMVSMACAGGVAGVLLLPLLAPLATGLRRQAFSREEATVRALSATWNEWRQVAPSAWVSLNRGEPSSGRQLSPGWLRLGLASAGGILLLRGRRNRRAAMFFLVLAGIAFLCSFGLNLELGPWRPWRTLTDRVPGFAQVRSVYRFAYFVQLACLLLAAMGVPPLGRGLRRGGQTRGAVAMRGCVQGTLCLVVAFEVLPGPIRAVGVPDLSGELPWVAYLRQQAPAGRSVVFLPLASGDTPVDYQQTARWMLYGTQHRIPLVNGYSGFFPSSWFRLRKEFSADPFGEPVRRILGDANVEFLVIQAAWLDATGNRAAAASRQWLDKVWADRSGVEIWRFLRNGVGNPSASILPADACRDGGRDIPNEEGGQPYQSEHQAE